MSAALQSIRPRDLPRRLLCREVQSLYDYEGLLRDFSGAFLEGFLVLQLRSQVRRISRVPLQNLTHGPRFPQRLGLGLHFMSWKGEEKSSPLSLEFFPPSHHKYQRDQESKIKFVIECAT